MDVRTPPSNAEAILPGFSQAAHVLVKNAGHESRELMSPEYRRLFQAFLRGEPVADTTISLPAIPLLPWDDEVRGAAESEKGETRDPAAP